MKYTAIYAKTDTGYSAYLPDIDGCVATGRTLTETKQRMQETLEIHLAGLREDGLSIPPPSTVADEVTAA